MAEEITSYDSSSSSSLGRSQPFHMPDIEELDPSEYEIPAIDHPPTLESILNDNDDLSLSEEESANLQDRFETSSLASISSQESRGSRLSRYSKTPPYGEIHGSLLKHATLSGIGAQI